MPTTYFINSRIKCVEDFAGIESSANERWVNRWARTSPDSNSGVGKAVLYNSVQITELNYY